MQWTTGDASDGSGGFGGSPAVAGFDSGDGTDAVKFFSGNTAASLTNLAYQSFYYLSSSTPAASEGVILTEPANGQSFSAPANITLNANLLNITAPEITFYNGAGLIGSASESPYTISLTNLAAGNYVFTAVATNTNGMAFTSPAVYVTVNVPGTSLINFDPLGASQGPVGEPGDGRLSAYLAQFGVSLTNNSPGTEVVVENEANLAGGNAVLAPSQPNLLTQIGSNGPVSFTVGFPLARGNLVLPGRNCWLIRL